MVNLGPEKPTWPQPSASRRYCRDIPSCLPPSVICSDRLLCPSADNSFHRQLQATSSPTCSSWTSWGSATHQTSVDDFYEVIAKRYEKKSSIITSNKEFNEWGRVLYDPVLATAILDRLVHHCNFVNIKGPSFRMREREGLEINPPKKRGRPAKISTSADGVGDEYTGEEDFDDEET